MLIPLDKGSTMPTTTDILSQARQRQQAASLPYAGAVTPDEAFALLSSDPAIRLIDVRTQAERDWVGKVLLQDGQHFSVQWTLYPGGAKNPDFLAQLAQCAQPDDVLLFLCRSGVRSRYAAELATAHGYRNCFDILEGFEGDRDNAGHRKSLGGWCKAGLPWIGA
jgi:rhodanese-related sulfurtransferase